MGRTPRGGLMAYSRGVRSRRLTAFFVTATVLSWSYWIPVAALDLGWSHFPGLLGPALAAVAVTAATEGRPGLRRLAGSLLRLRVAALWYGVVAAPLLIAVVLVAARSAGGVPWPETSEWSRIGGLPDAGIVGTPLLLLLLNGVGEELGWRGYAVEHLPGGSVRAGLLVVGPWALWHVPTFFLPTGLAGMSLALAAGWLVGLVAGSIVLAWLYRGSGGSTAVAVLFHTSFNLATATAATAEVAAGVSAAVIIGAVTIARRGQASRDR